METTAIWMPMIKNVDGLSKFVGPELPAPEVAFTASDGRVSFFVTRDGTPSPDAILRIWDNKGTLFGEATADASGRGWFDMPQGDCFTLEITADSRVALPIRLTKIGSEVVPKRVSLCFELRPCCRVPKRPFTILNHDIPVLFPRSTGEISELVTLATVIAISLVLGLRVLRSQSSRRLRS